MKRQNFIALAAIFTALNLFSCGKKSHDDDAPEAKKVTIDPPKADDSQNAGYTATNSGSTSPFQQPKISRFISSYTNINGKIDSVLLFIVDSKSKDDTINLTAVYRKSSSGLWKDLSLTNSDILGSIGQIKSGRLTSEMIDTFKLSVDEAASKQTKDDLKKNSLSKLFYYVENFSRNYSSLEKKDDVNVTIILNPLGSSKNTYSATMTLY